MPVPGPIPVRAGIGLRAQHQAEILARRPAIHWLEAHSENYFGDGGAQVEELVELARRHPLSLHGVGLSLGSTDPLDEAHLARLARLVARVQPALVSEHVAWGAAGGRHANDLLPLPYTREALAHLAGRIREVQARLGRRLLVENVSSYVEFGCAEMSEPEFLAALVATADCGLLLDVNNVYVSATNHGFDARAFLDALPRDCVGEIHLAGHSVVERDGHRLLVDTHSTHVCAALWSLYEHALARFGAVPTLVEWDMDLPPLDVLLAEAAEADRRLLAAHALAA